MYTCLVSKHKYASNKIQRQQPMITQRVHLKVHIKDTLTLLNKIINNTHTSLIQIKIVFQKFKFVACVNNHFSNKYIPVHVVYTSVIDNKL